MRLPEYYQQEDGYLLYRPLGNVSLVEGIGLVNQAIAFARQNGIRRLLVDVTGLTGYDLPTLSQRYAMGEQFARLGLGVVRVAMVAPEELVDPERFGVKVAHNRGLVANVFLSADKAREWLLGDDTEFLEEDP